MRMYDIILNKREGKKLTTKEIEYFVDNYIKGAIPDYQAASLLMAIFLNGLSKKETIDLTYSMAKSGEIIDLSCIQGVKVDKHSTGGVGDKTTLIVGPIVASCGIPFAKMSGRSLGHTGGTIDKLESIDGFKVNLSKEDFIKNVNKNKISIISQSQDIAPADKKLYALRDVTATVDSLPLIASSIMSKKLASGSDAILLDVKVGNGAFMKKLDEAIELAEIMVEIGQANGKPTIALITDMNQPLGKAIGNSVEVAEAIDTLVGEGPDDLNRLCTIISAYMLLLSGVSKSLTEAKIMVKNAVKQGSAIKKFEQFVCSQGGHIDIDNFRAQSADHIVPIISNKSGYIHTIDTYGIGMSVKSLGAGRDKKEDPINYSVGLVLNKKVGDCIKQGDILGNVYSNDKAKAENAINSIINCIRIDNIKPVPTKLIYGLVDEHGYKVIE
ncbi:MAG: pyrimidine-nucleoside phosphorylase [Clostridia bacterium]|nr:pyrimidine-nucleoside phosphorylase [Clostridia bacterium]